MGDDKYVWNILGRRLHDFSILIGNKFTSGVANIGSWSECAHFSGKQLS